MIEISQLNCFDGTTKILDNIELTLPRFCKIGIIGQSGSGKSTLAKACAMLLADHLTLTGTILYEGQNILSLKESKKRALRKHHLKYLVQEPFFALNPYLKIKTQLKEAFGFEASSKELYEALGLVELQKPGLLDLYPHQLSGGQRQRLALLQALVSKPKVLIADEPTTALDPILQKQILLLIKNYISTEKSSLIFVSHDIKAAKLLTDQIIVMKEGKIIETLPSSDLFEKAKHPYTLQLLESSLNWKHKRLQEFEDVLK